MDSGTKEQLGAFLDQAGTVGVVDLAEEDKVEPREDLLGGSVPIELGEQLGGELLGGKHRDGQVRVERQQVEREICR